MKKALRFNILLPALLLLSTMAFGQLSGIYTINGSIPASSTNYQTFSSAASDLSTFGVSGSVVFYIAAGTYNEALEIDTILGASTSNTITFNGGSAATTTLKHNGSNPNGTVILTGADYVTIKNLTIENTATGNDAWGIFLTGRADHVTIDHCIINMGVTTSSDNGGIIASADPTNSSTGGDNAHNLTVSNCEIHNGYYGLRMEGGNASSGQLDSNITIHNNIFLDNYGYGVSLDDIAKITLTNNSVSGIGSSTKDGYNFDDIVNFEFTGNYAHVPDYAMEIDDGNFSADGTPASSPSLIANNMLISTDDDALNIDDVENVHIYHNTLHCQGTGTGDIALYFGDGDTVDIRNNIIVADDDHAIYVSSNVGYYTADYNIYYTGGSTLADISGSERQTLTAWKLSDSSKNNNSKEGDPGFTSTTDLHVIGTLADGAADNATSIVSDFDGDVRPAPGSTIKDIGADEFIGPTCPPPSGLFAFGETSNSANVSWTAGGANNWMVQYGTTGFTPGSGTFVATSNDTLLLSSLSPQTIYDVYVRDSCSANDVSPWLGPISFTTKCITSALPYLENFNSGSFPICWNRSSTTDVNVISSCSGRSNVLEFNYTEEATTAAVDASGVQSIQVGYYIGAGACTNDPEDNEHFQVLYWDGTQWVLAKDYDGTMPQSFVWDSFIVPQSALTNNFQVKFDMIHGTTDAWQIDSVVIEEGPSCPPPYAVGTLNITNSSADVYWTSGGASNWMIQYGTSGFSLGTGTLLAASNDTITLSGLTGQTTYDVYIKDSCNATSTSTWAGPFTFTTPCSAILAPYTQSFDSTYIPSCWTETAVSGGPWEFSGSTNPSTCGAATDHTGNGGSYAWMDHSGADATVSLTTGVVDITNLTVPYLRFYYWMCGSVTPPNILYIEAYNGSSWTAIDTIASGTSGWDKFAYVLTNYTYGNNLVQIRFTAESGGSGIDYNADQALDDVEIIEAPNCLVSTNLSAFNITNSGASVTWTPGGSASNWLVQYGTSGFTPGTGTFVATANDTVNLSGLLAQTKYDVYVQDSCGINNTSVLLGPISFTTLCSPIIAPYTENFDSLALAFPYTALPDCWEAQTGPDYWDVTNDSVNAGHSYLPNYGDHTSGNTNYMWIDASNNITGNAMTTGSIDMSALTTPYAGFWFASNNTNNNINHTIKLDAWNGTSWVNIDSERGNFVGWVEVSGIVPSSIPTITKFRIQAIADTAGTSSTYYYNDLGVDDFFIVEAPSCPAPANLGVAGVTSNSANVFWTTGGSSYHQIEYGPAGFSQGTGFTLNVANDTAALTSLFPNTAYEFYVRDSCSATDLSTWSGPFMFTTPCSFFMAPFLEDFELGSLSINCWSNEYTSGAKDWIFATGSSGGSVSTSYSGNRNARFTSSGSGPHITKFITPVIDVSSLTTPQLEFAYAQEAWSGDQNYLNVYYRDSANGAWNLIWTDSTSKASWTLAQVVIPSTSTTLQLSFEGIDNYGRANVIDDVQVKEAPSCPPPSNLGATNITATTADVYFTPGGSAAYYRIEYGLTGFTQGTGLSMVVTNDTVSLSNLMSNTLYDFYVEDSCGTNLTSTIAGPFTFNTLCNAYSAPFFEDFESTSGTTICWSQEYVNGTKDWVFASGSTGGSISSAYSGALNARFTSSGGGPHISKLISPVIDASGLSSTMVSFAYGQQVWSGDQNYLNVYYRDSANGAWVHAFSDSTNQAAWVTTDVLIASTSSTLQIAFEGVDNYGRAVVIDDVEIKQAPSCPPSANLGVTNVTTTSADLYWTSYSTASYYIIEYGPAGFIPCTGPPMTVISTNDTLSITNLLPSTTYEFYVIDSCANGSSGCPGTGPFVFSTLCNTIIAPFFEDFEVATGTSDCWSQNKVSGNSNWSFASGSSGGSVSTAYSGSLNARHTSSVGGPNITKLISPLIDASALSTSILSFAYAQEDWFGDQNYLNVYYRDSANGAWNYLWSDSTSQAAWTTAQVTVPSNSTSLQFGFEGVDNYGRAVVLDDVSLTGPLVCSAPDSIMVAPMCTEADITWTSEAGASTTIEYGPTGFAPGSGTLMYGITSPFTLNNLTMGMSYDFYLIDTCTNNIGSSWTSATMFTTDTMPIASFMANMNAAPHPDTVQYEFDAMSSIGANNYWWDYGDGSANNTGVITTHNYSQNGTYTVTLVATNNCGSDTATQEVVVEGIGLEEHIINNVELYPNPNTGKFSITGLLSFGSDISFEIVTASGVVVHQEQMATQVSDTYEIDVQGLPAGIYLLKVSSSKGMGIRSFVLRN